MDPITSIVAALAVGASAGIADTASQALKDAYSALKRLVGRRFAGNARAEQTLLEHEVDPETYEKPLAKQIRATGADQDSEILRAADHLLRLAGGQHQGSLYKVTVTGGKVGIIGDGGHIETMN